jgi:hypothetical protein
MKKKEIVEQRKLKSVRWLKRDPDTKMNWPTDVGGINLKNLQC